jgi:hypothetical protein
MAKDEKTILQEILDHINKEGGAYNTWYTGITSNVESRLHGDHKVPEKDHWFITRPTENNETARRIERTLIEQYGTDGGLGGGDYDSTTVYSYKKTSITDP